MTTHSDNEDTHEVEECIDSGDTWADQDVDTGETWADEEVDADGPSAATPDAEDESPAAPRDPWANVLLVVVLSLVVALVATTGVLFFYLTSLNEAPRTMLERDIHAAEALAAEQADTTRAWAALAYVYANAGRYDDALAAVERGKKLPDPESMFIVEADILRMAGRHAEALEAYETALEKAQELRERIVRERAEKGILDEISDDGSLFQVYSGRAAVKVELGDTDGAIADFVLATEQNPRQAPVWVSLGDLYAEAGDIEAAEKAYRSALRVVPDYEDALRALERIGKGE